jgi:peptide/nickel transport system permease protein
MQESLSQRFSRALCRDAPLRQSLVLLWRDKFAFFSALFLLAAVFCAIFGPSLLGAQAKLINIRMRNAASLSFANGWLFVLGGDALGRPILARLIVGARNSIGIASGALFCSVVIGATLGLVAGYRNNWISEVIMRFVDILMSFPTLLLALIVLYVLEPSVMNVVWILALTGVPNFLRVTRAEVLEIRERMFVTAARVMGARPKRIVWRHIRPMVMPTVVTVATLEFALMMLSESTLSFLGLGIQAPDFSWGLMVAEGQNYLGTAWWLAVWPGFAITLTVTSLNLLANWVRIVTDPVQRWRLDAREEPNG